MEAWVITAILLVLAHMVWVFKVAQSRLYHKYFFVVLFAPLLLAWYFYQSLIPVLGWLWLLVLVERYFWAMTLYRVSGEDKIGWYILIYLFSPLGWLLFYFTEWDWRM